MIIDFLNDKALVADLAGGKGLGLAKAAQAGLPVPYGVILTSKAYSLWFTPHINEVEKILSQEKSDTEKSDEITAYLKKQSLPQEVTNSLEKIQQADPKQYFAVRSSGSAEDMLGAAFAGLHDTLLNINGAQELANAVKQCWLSLWNAHVLPYRSRLGIKHTQAAMAVVIQQMVDVGSKEAAGVAFSIDPVGGDISKILINAAFGLGETVVAGESQ